MRGLKVLKGQKEAPPERREHSAIYDPDGKQMLIFGGINRAGIFSDLWAFDIEKNEWKEIKGVKK